MTLGKRRFAVLLVLAAALSIGPARAQVGAVHPDGEGRLSANSGSGGFIADAPGRHPYWTSHGQFLLCDTGAGDSADPITLVRVGTIHPQLPPLRVLVYLRTVTPEQVRQTPRDQRGDKFSIATADDGRPPRFLASPPSFRPGGSFDLHVVGQQITQDCDDAWLASGTAAQGKVPKQAFTVLVFAVKTGAAGSRIRRAFVDYTVGDRLHTLRIDWTMGGRGYTAS